MKKIIYIAFAAAMLTAVSCAKELELKVGQDVAEQGLTLRFTSGAMATRADVDGVNNENLIKRIDYFLFPLNAEGTAVDDDAEYVFRGELSPEDGGLTGTYETTITTGVLSKIFPDGATKAMVFAVANYVDQFGANNDMTGEGDKPLPNTTFPYDDVKTWKAIHELEVGPTFFYDDQDPGFLLRWPHVLDTDDDNLFFVMTGEEEVELQTTGSYAIDATVALKRLASKVSVAFTYENVVEEKTSGNITWVPQSESPETRVYMSNAIEHATLGGPLRRDLVADSWTNATKPLGYGTRDIFEYAYNFMNDITEVDDDGNKTAHFYTYPISLEEGDDNQSYLKLVLPWYGYKNYGTSDQILYKQKEVYYKIVLPRETFSEPNCIYEYKVAVNIIGADKEVKITGYEYAIKDWLTDEPISSNVATGRYISLDIPKDTYDMYGSQVEILYVSSGEVEITNLQIYKSDFKNATTVYYIDGTPISYVSPYSATTEDYAGVTLPNWATVNGTELVINHTMNTNINSSDVDISPYHFVVTLHLKDAEGTQFDRTVHITQYPPIYVSTIETASNTVYLRGTAYPSSGSTTVYNNQGSSGIGLGSLGGGQVNTGTSLTVVTVTTLAALDVSAYTTAGVGTPLIGDPRVKLSSAYPTDPRTDYQWGTDDLGSTDNNYIADYLYAAMDKSNFIAPKLMLASGYGANTGTGSWIRNAERCASYQEAGYPAGRWRLPTEAEMMFVYTLGDNGLIVQPFQSSKYWANSGRYYTGGTSFTSSTSSSESRSVRCVYDLWYWGDDKLSDPESWGGFQTDYIN